MRTEFRRGEGESPRHAELQHFVRKIAIICLFVIGLVFLWYVRNVLMLLFIAGVLAAGIAPTVRRVRTLIRHYTGKNVKRGTAVLVVYLPFLISAVLLLLLGGPHLLAESKELSAQLPRQIDQKLLTPMAAYIPAEEARQFLYGDWRGQFPVFGLFRGAVSIMVSIIAVLVLIAYMLIEGERLTNIFLLLYPPEERWRKRLVVLRASRRMSAWLAGQLLLAAIIGGATFIGLSLLGIPYALPLAMIAAIGEVVPVVGPILSAVPVLVIALLQSTGQFWAALIFMVLLQQAENHFLVPRLMGRKVSVSPLAVLVAFMIGGTLLGIAGAIMAVPAAAITQVAFEEGFVTRRERRLDSTRPGTLSRTDME